MKGNDRLNSQLYNNTLMIGTLRGSQISVQLGPNWSLTSASFSLPLKLWEVLKEEDAEDWSLKFTLSDTKRGISLHAQKNLTFTGTTSFVPVLTPSYYYF